MTDITTDPLNHISTLIAAVGALGTAAFGLVDASKLFAFGMSNAGFKFIRLAVTPFVRSPNPNFGETEIIETLRANWLNGVAKADQKAVAKSLIRLGLTPNHAPALAAASGVDPAALTAAAQKIANGDPLVEPDLNVLGRFDAIVSAALDFGYERADQRYRNGAKVAACVVSVFLAVMGGAVLNKTGSYWCSREVVIAILVGVISTPLAPIAKDLTTSLAAAVKAVAAVRR